MPIFGARDQFGKSRFGQANYGELSLYELIPDVHRALDEEQGAPLRKLLTAFQEELEDIRRHIDLLPYQRDPYLATGLDYPAQMLIIAAENLADGVRLTLDVDHDVNGEDQVDILGCAGDLLAGRYQILRVIGPRDIVIDAPALADVNAPFKAVITRVASNSCLVEILGIDVYEDTWGDVKKTLSRITLSNHSAVEDIGVGYTGILKAFKPVPPPENAFTEPSQALYRVLYVRRRDQSIGSPVELICEGGLRLEDIEGVLPERLVLRFVRPSSLALLANDYGLVTDENLPDVFQRSEIANVYQFLRLKSSRPAYEARSRGGGFRVSVTQLFKLCEDQLDLVPDTNVFIGESGGGNIGYYSNINVVRPHFDDLSADLVTPTGVPITDITFYASPALTSFDREIDAFISCLFKVTVNKTLLVEEGFEQYGRPGPFTMVQVFVDFPNNGWQVGTLRSGNFALIDDEGQEWFIWDSNHADGQVLDITTLYLDSPSVNFESGDELCVAYRPVVSEVDCCLCPSSEIMIEIEALPAFINQSGYSGEALADAYRRILDRIKREQVPIHVHTAIETLVVNIDVVVPSFSVEPLVSLDIEDILVDLEEGQRYDCRFDDMPADEEPLDTCAEVASYPGVLLDVASGPGPVDQLTVDITIEPLDTFVVTDITIESAFVRDIIVTGSSHFDDTPADDVETDNDLVGITPTVTIEIE